MLTSHTLPKLGNILQPPPIWSLKCPKLPPSLSHLRQLFSTIYYQKRKYIYTYHSNLRFNALCDVHYIKHWNVTEEHVKTMIFSIKYWYKCGKCISLSSINKTEYFLKPKQIPIYWKKKSILALKTLNVCFLTHYNRCTREVVAHGLKGLLTVHFVYNATKQSTGSEWNIIWQHME